MANEEFAVEKIVLSYNRNKSERELKVVEVLLRVPCFTGSLDASREGPYKVNEMVFRVTYKVKKDEEDRERVVHINNTKCYKRMIMDACNVCSGGRR